MNATQIDRVEQSALSTRNGPGMYLFFTDGHCIDFSDLRVKQLAEMYWGDPAKLPREVREHDDFKTCTVCPYRGQDVFCSAMKPLLPFLEEIDRFESFEPVVAVYVGHDGVKQVSKTTLQRGLQYVCNMALFEYCEDAKDYRRYFKGIHPFMELESAAAVLYLNVYWLMQGDKPKIERQIREIAAAIHVTSESCVKRLRTMCKSDPFINSYILTHTFASSFEDIEVILDEYFNPKNPFPVVN